MDEPTLKTATDASEQGATAIITHRVAEGLHHGYERWLGEIDPVCRAALGHLDTQIVRPVTGQTAYYTVIIRFDSLAHLEAWMGSTQRQQLIEKAQPFLVQGDDFFIRSGLDFWFTPGAAKALLPVRWKQFLVTWSAIFPLVMLMPVLLEPLLRALGLSDRSWLSTLLNTGLVVFLMVYVVMPRYTRLLQRWLFR